MMDCTKGIIDESNFSKPMPIIGLYIAVATLLCIVAMAMDLVQGINSKQFWIPAKYFRFNAASITIIGVAIKLSVDLNSPMPSQIDQLGKLATSAFACVVLSNIIPSLGKLKEGELLANTIALAILLITLIVNLIIQLKTGVLHAFRIAHIFMIVMMSFLLYVCTNISVRIPFIRRVLLSRYEYLQQQALSESSVDINESIIESNKIKKYLIKMSILAQSSCPHFALSRLVVFLVAFFGIMPALAFFFVLILTIIHSGKMVGLNTCSGESDYGWSVTLILVVQAIAIVMGSVSALSKWIYCIFSGIRSGDVDLTNSSARNEETAETEKFWTQFVGISPLDSVFSYIEYWQQGSMIVYRVKVILSQFSYESQLESVLKWEEINKRPSSDSSNQELDELRPYFVHCAEEERFIKYLVESSLHVTHKYMNAEKRGPRNLIGFIEKYLSPDFEGVWSFEDDRVTPLSSSGHPPNCWSLPLLIMTCIATALPNIDRKKWLWKCVSEGLVYVKLVEDNLNGVQHLVNIRDAAHRLWYRFIISQENILFGVRLDELAQNHKTPKEVLLSLAKSAQNAFSRFSNQKNLPASKYRLIRWRNKAIEPGFHRGRICRAVTAHSMYKICETILQDCQNENNLEPSSDDIFNRLCKNIADILGACFTNLGQCIILRCKTSTLEERREEVFRMLKVFGETEMIMEILEEEGRKIPELPKDKLAFIDEWRSYPNPSP